MCPPVFIIDFPGYQSHASIYPSIARADFSVCVRPSIRPLHDDSCTLPTIPPSRSSVLSALPALPVPFPRPYPLVEATLATAAVVAAAAAAAVAASAVPSIVDMTRLGETCRGSRQQRDRPRGRAILHDRVRRRFLMPVDIPLLPAAAFPHRRAFILSERMSVRFIARY